MLPMVSNICEDISIINKDINYAGSRLAELRNNLENNRKSNAKQESFQTQSQEEDASSMFSLSSTQKFSSPNMTTSVKSLVFVPLVHLTSDKGHPDPSVITKSRRMSKRVKLNVGGTR